MLKITFAATLCKQTKLINEGGFSKYERQNFKYIIYTSIITNFIKCLSFLIDVVSNGHNSISYTLNVIDLKNKYRMCIHQLHSYLRMDTIYNLEWFNIVDSLLSNDDTFKQFLCDGEFKKQEYNVVDSSLTYFVSSFERLKSNEYLPNDLDILQCHYETVGIGNDYTTTIGSRNLKIAEFGGTLAERKKWKNYMQSLSLPQQHCNVIFCISLECVFKNCENSLEDSLHCLEEFHKNQSGSSKTQRIVIVFTKADVFVQKLKEGCAFSNFVCNNLNIKTESSPFEIITKLQKVLQKHANDKFENLKGTQLEFHFVNNLNNTDVKQLWLGILEQRQSYVTDIIKGKNTLFSKVHLNTTNYCFHDIEIIN